MHPTFFVRNFSLLSFGEEAEEDEEQTDKASKVGSKHSVCGGGMEYSGNVTVILWINCKVLRFLLLNFYIHVLCVRTLYVIVVTSIDCIILNSYTILMFATIIYIVLTHNTVANFNVIL